MYKIIAVLISVILFSFSVMGQSKKSLERKKRKTQKEISYTNKLLKETKSSKIASYNELLLIEKKITLREELINNIINEQSQLKQEIDENNEIIESLEADLKKIKKEYAEMLRFAYEHRNKNDVILFIFSAESFNQAFKRMKYIQQYSEYRKKQAKAIVVIKEQINTRIVKLEEQKLELDQLISEHTQESIALRVEKSSQNRIIINLSSEEQNLKKTLERYQREKIRIQNSIADIIRKEAARARAKNKKNAYEALTPEQKLISKNFGENKGRLPWPVSRGIITYKFGLQAHPVLKNIKEKKNGVGISTTKGSLARSVFAGTVTNILPLSGNNSAIMIKHGEYITVYVNIKEVMVTVGQSVTAKQEIGTVYTNADDQRTTLELQIWKGTKLQNPIYWISKKK